MSVFRLPRGGEWPLVIVTTLFTLGLIRDYADTVRYGQLFGLPWRYEGSCWSHASAENYVISSAPVLAAFIGCCIPAFLARTQARRRWVIAGMVGTYAAVYGVSNVERWMGYCDK